MLDTSKAKQQKNYATYDAWKVIIFILNIQTDRYFEGSRRYIYIP